MVVGSLKGDCELGICSFLMTSFLFRDECKEWIPFIILKFNFMAGQCRDWTAGAVIYMQILCA